MSEFDTQGLVQVVASIDRPSHKRIVDGAITEITTLRHQLTTAQAENEALRKRAVELEADNAHQRGRRNAARKCIADMKGPWLLRKQAEAVEETQRLISQAEDIIGMRRAAREYSESLRQQAEELEAGGSQ